MNLPLIISFGILFISCFIAFFYYQKARRILNSVNSMLNSAINGSFNEAMFDETLLSSIESKFSHYLASSHVSKKALSLEHDKIKELIADIAHQTKTPLSNIMLYTQLLSEQTLSEENNLYLSELTAQAKKLDFLITSLLKTSRLETGIIKLSPCLSEILPMLEAIQRQMASKVREKNIFMEILPSSEKAYFDTKWTGEAIYNIVDNAVKYTPNGGKIKISVCAYELFCRIDISDTGIGISEDEHAKIFTRFYRSPQVSSSEGVGIGLYLAREIIAQEGGYIKVSSIPNRGCTFSVFLKREA